jgi:hypothetical protein
MNTEMGEYIVGAYLKLIKECDFVDYNVRRPNGGLAGLNEIDLIGLDFKEKRAYLCEVTTHLDGVLYGSSKEVTCEKIQKKFNNLKSYAKEYLSEYKPTFMFWSPRVSSGVVDELENINKLKLVVNTDYTSCVNELREKAKDIKSDTNNPAFRIFQILEHLRN